MKPAIKTISKSVTTALSPVDIYQGFAEHSQAKNVMLLESSEVESKIDVKSIILLQSALRIECNGNQVVVTALTANGENALSAIEANLNAMNMNVESDNSKRILSLTYAPVSAIVDEDTRIKQLSPIDILRTIQGTFSSNPNIPYSLFLAGLFAFDFIANFESLPSLSVGKNTCPDFVFYLAESLLVIDHQNNHKRLMSNHFSGEEDQKTYFELARGFEQLEKQIQLIQPPTTHGNELPTTSSVTSAVTTDVDDEDFKSIVSQLKHNIVAGDIFQVVPSRTFSIPCRSPIESYRRLKQSNPSPYLFYMSDQSFDLFGASPESALKYSHQDNAVELYPIAGTRPRGKKSDGRIDLDLDARIEAELKLDKKELSEHMMLVDLARNDIARIAEPGSTHVPKLLAVDRYSQVMHLVSCVRGQLKGDLDILHAYLACMNMGTLTGAPKIKATQLIRQVEQKRRGSYGGAVGYITGKGDMDTCIVIRSAFYKDGVAHVQAGAGVVYDSDPELESQETRSKAQAVLNAIVSSNNALNDQSNHSTNQIGSGGSNND